MAGPGRDPDQISSFAEGHQHLLAQMQAEQAATFHEEPHLVFGVGVLSQEFLSQCLAVRVGRVHPDRIDRSIAPFGLNPGHIAGIGAQDRVLVSAIWKVLRCGPLFEADAPIRQFGLDRGRVVADQFRQRCRCFAPVWKDAETTHGLSSAGAFRCPSSTSPRQPVSPWWGSARVIRIC